MNRSSWLLWLLILAGACLACLLIWNSVLDRQAARSAGMEELRSRDYSAQPRGPVRPQITLPPPPTVRARPEGSIIGGTAARS